MKFTFLKEKELELINNRFAEENSVDFDYWHLMTDEENLITDASMFVTGVYCYNKFDSIEEFAKNVSEGEGDTVENTIKRLNEMLSKGILRLN